MKRKRPLHYKLLQLHRWTGLFAAALVIILALTGIALEHTEDWSLDERFINSPIVLKRYGITPNPIQHYAINTHSISQSGNHLYLDEQALTHSSSTLCGAAKISLGFALCIDSAILLVDKHGHKLDLINSDLGLPDFPLGLGSTSSQQLVLLGAQGNWLADADMLAWQRYNAKPSVEISPSAPNESLKTFIEKHSISHEISWERLLLDLHSGRLFGSWGVYLMDIVSLAMIYLALSGIWVWWKRR